MNHDKPEAKPAHGEVQLELSQTNGSRLTREVTKEYVPPDEGLEAWLRVLAAFLLFMSSWGPALSYGTFQAYYERSMLSTKSTSDISWIGSITTTLLIVTGGLAGPLFDRGYLKPLMTLGCFLQIFGIMMLSISTKYYQLILSQGFCYGIGAGLVFVPGLAFVLASFSTKRGIAVGLSASGSSVGGIVFPILFVKLQPKIGFPWTCRVIAFIQLGLSAVALSILAKAPVRKQKPRKLFEWHAFRSSAFCMFFIANFCQFLAYWIPLFFVPTYAHVKLGTSDDFGVYLTVFINAASAFGRILPAFLFNRVGASLVVTGCVISATVLLFGWIGITSSVPGFIVWCLLFGFITGVFISGNPVVVAHPIISPSLDVVGTRTGILFFAGGIGALIGNPIAGILADPARKDFLSAQAFAGAIMAVGAMSLTWVTICVRRYDKQLKAVSDEDKS